jgi:hypothetical protein
MLRRRMMRVYAAAIVVFCVTLGQRDRAIAQSGSTFELARTSFSSVHEYVAREVIPRQLATPENLIIADTYRPLIESMLRQSPTFRRQCARIAADAKLMVRVNLAAPPWRDSIRAMTQVKSQRDGHMVATSQIAPTHDQVELIAHEIEHVIEQLDGVDLHAHAERTGSGVLAMSGTRGVFETRRATQVGRKVTLEVRD